MQAAAGDASVSVFSGIAGPLEAAGVQVKITRWFQGAIPPSGIAVLEPGGFNDPMGNVFNSCGTNAPTQGTEWIFIAGRNEVGRYGVSLCSTHAPLDAPEGQALLAEAQDVFGAPAVPVPPLADNNDIDTASPIETVLPIVLGGLFAVGLVGGLVRDPRPPRPRRSLEEPDDVPVGVDVDVLATRLRRAVPASSASRRTTGR